MTTRSAEASQLEEKFLKVEEDVSFLLDDLYERVVLPSFVAGAAELALCIIGLQPDATKAAARSKRFVTLEADAARAEATLAAPALDGDSRKSNNADARRLLAARQSIKAFLSFNVAYTFGTFCAAADALLDDRNDATHLPHLKAVAFSVKRMRRDLTKFPALSKDPKLAFARDMLEHIEVLVPSIAELM